MATTTHPRRSGALMTERRTLVRMWVIAAITGLAGAMVTTAVAAPRTVIDGHPVRVEVLTEALSYPWALTFLPDGAALITERDGRLRLWAEGRLDPRPVAGVPAVWASGQGGLLDVLAHPAFDRTGWIYLSLSHPDGGGRAHTRVVRAVFDRAAHALRDVTVIADALPTGRGGRHFGARLAFGPDGMLYVTTGDRGDSDRAQDPMDLAGKILRLTPDGGIPDGNPFLGRADARPEIFALGTRNGQGMDVHSETGAVWFHEHGPRGGDELNLARPGVNYGWPVVTHGRAYSGLPIGEGREKPGMEPPVWVWVPSIAPSGLAIYDGDLFPNWRGDLFVGALKVRLIARLEMDGDRVVDEQRVLEGDLGRLRALEVGPEGALYLLTDDSEGMLARLVPDP